MKICINWWKNFKQASETNIIKIDKQINNINVKLQQSYQLPSQKQTLKYIK